MNPLKGLVPRNPVISVLVVAAVLAGSAVIASTGASGKGGRTRPQPVAAQDGLRAEWAPTPTAAAKRPARAVAPPPKNPVQEQQQRCTLDALLVPRCGVLWGVAPGAYTDLTPSRAVRKFEATTGRPSDILHSYHRGDDLFPTGDQLSAVRQQRKRILFANWKVAWGTTWAKVAAGAEDARIDRLAAHIRRTFPERFFMAIHHEPENDLRATPGSGMTARDFAAMYRHTVERLRKGGVTNAVFVMVYMAYEPWLVQPWFEDLYPGDDVVDWIGFDAYLYAKPGGYGHGDFSYLVNRTSNPVKWPGFYNWVTRTHGDKPLMIAEWGVYEYAADPAKKAWIYSTVAKQLSAYPKIKAMVYFDSPAAEKGDTRPDSSAAALDEYKRLAESTVFDVHLE